MSENCYSLSKLLLKALDKALSRKFIVFLVGTVLYIFNRGIDENGWLFLASLYAGIEGSIDILSVARRPKQVTGVDSSSSEENK